MSIFFYLKVFFYFLNVLSQYVNELSSPLTPEGGTTTRYSPFGDYGTFVENNGVEPLTSCVQGRRSSQLS